MILFAGPSLSDRARSLIEDKRILLRPPVQRLQIGSLVQQGYRGPIGIADGVFHQVIAVGHAEIRYALQQGCRVFGLCSMGAIRAYEMRYLGMEGFGEVYRYFHNMDDFQDDELALYHFPAPAYTPISEPMVHFRACLEHLTDDSTLSPEVAKNILQSMKQRYYGDRTLPAFKDLLDSHNISGSDQILASFDKYRIKQHDLVNFVESEIWTY